MAVEALRTTSKSTFEKNITDDKMAEMILDLFMSKELFKEKYGFDKTTALVVFDDLAEEYPEEKLRSLVTANNRKDILITGKRVKDAREIRIKLSPEVYSDYKEFMAGYKETMKTEIFSEVVRRGLEAPLSRKRAGEKVVCIPATEAQLF